MFGEKIFSGVGYPTPLSIPDTTTCLIIQVPASDEWWALMVGLLYELTLEWNWQQYEGGLDRDVAASAWQAMLQAALDLASESNSCNSDVPAPFWDEDSADDSDDSAPITDQPWYGQLVLIDGNLTFVENAFIYLVSGFIAYAGLPTAAISFIPIARNFVVTFKSNPLGGIIKFFADGVAIGQVDTYSAADGVISAPLALPAGGMGFVAEDTSPVFWVELSDENPHGLESVSMTLIRSRLSESQLGTTSYRYNSDCACVQYSPDGGTTWNDAPGSDPRNAPQFRFPERTGSDIQCNCAANARAWIKGVIDRVTAILAIGGIVVEIANEILRFAEIIFAEAGGWLLNLILDAAGTLFGIGYAAISGAFDTTQYDLLLCALYCNADAGGQYDDTRFAALQAMINATMNSTAAAVVNLFLSIQGKVGLSNAGAIGTETADCTSCMCDHCFVIDFTVSDGTEWGYVPQGGSWTDAIGWVGQFDSPISVSNVYGYWAFPETLTVSKIQIDYTKQNGSGGNDVNWFFALNPATNYNLVNVGQNLDDSGRGIDLTKEIIVGDSLGGTGYDINTGEDSGPSIALRLRVYYTGDIPDGWSDNC